MTAYEAFSLLLVGSEDWTQVIESMKLTLSSILLALDQDLNVPQLCQKPKDSIISPFFLMFMKYLLLISSVIGPLENTPAISFNACLLSTKWDFDIIKITCFHIY